MIKRIVSLAVTVIMMFTFTACGVSLESYKATKSEELQAYADAKGQDNYTVDAWAEICEAVIGGKQAITAAKNKDDVNDALTKAKTAIDAVAIRNVFNLDSYKATKSEELQTYAGAKGEDNYTAEGWAEICQAVTDGKQAIATAENKAAVDAALTEAKEMIDKVGTEIMSGVFYGLQKAYDEGLLTVDDLKSIAHYQSGGRDEPLITPKPKNPESLSSKIINSIKQTYLASLLAATNLKGELMYPNASIDDINSWGYYGTYNGAVAIKISNPYVYYSQDVKTLVVEGITFTYTDPSVRIWKAN